MIRGSFLNNPANTPVVPLTVTWGEAVLRPVFVLDTGFSGDLKMSPAAASDLGLLPVGVEAVTIADGSRIEIPVALGKVEVDGDMQSVSILVADGLPLAGIGLLAKFGFKATFDCARWTVEIEKAK